MPNALHTRKSCVSDEIRSRIPRIRPVPTGGVGVSLPPAKILIRKSTKFSKSVGKFELFYRLEV